MLWKEFKKCVEDKGVTDETVIDRIDVILKEIYVVDVMIKDNHAVIDYF